jgi:hypothetical protein
MPVFHILRLKTSAIENKELTDLWVKLSFRKAGIPTAMVGRYTNNGHKLRFFDVFKSH